MRKPSVNYWVEATLGQIWVRRANIANRITITCCSLAMISAKTGRFLKRAGVQAWYSHQRCLPPLSTGSTHAQLSSGTGNWKEHEGGRRTKENNALIASAVGATCIVGKAKTLNVVRLTACSPVGSLSSNGMRIACVDGINLKYALRWHIYPHISSLRTMPVYTHKHAHTRPQTI